MDLHSGLFDSKEPGMGQGTLWLPDIDLPLVSLSPLRGPVEIPWSLGISVAPEFCPKTFRAERVCCICSYHQGLLQTPGHPTMAFGGIGFVQINEDQPNEKCEDSLFFIELAIARESATISRVPAETQGQVEEWKKGKVSGMP